MKLSVQKIQRVKGEIRRCISGLENSTYHWKTPNKFQIIHIFYSLDWLERSIMEYKIMTRGGKQPNKSFEFKGFANMKLTDDMKGDFDAWDCHDGDVFDGVAGLLSAGYKLSVSETADRKGVSCSVTGTQHHKKNHGLCVTSYAPTVYDAFRLALYKVTVLMPDDWNTISETGDKPVWG